MCTEFLHGSVTTSSAISIMNDDTIAITHIDAKSIPHPIHITRAGTVDNAYMQPHHLPDALAKPLTLLLADTDGPATATRRLGVLATHAQAPEVTQTSVHADLLHALQVLAQLAVHAVGQDLAVLAVDDVALSVQEPGRDLVLRWVLHDGDDALEFFRGEFTGAVCPLSMISSLSLHTLVTLSVK